MSEPKVVTCTACDGTGVRAQTDELQVSGVRSVLKQRLDVYRYREALCEKLHGNAELNRRERAELAGEARSYGLVSNEIEALLSEATACQCGVPLGVSHFCSSLDHCWTGKAQPSTARSAAGATLGSRVSPRKATSSAENGKLGGRPKRKK